MADRVGQQLGNYRLTRLLGQGGFAEVYLGEHVYIGTPAALKVLTTQLTGQDREQFRIEATILAHLEHPHIVRVFEFGIDQTTPFLVMDYAPGGSLRTRHPKGSRVALSTVISYVSQVASALQYAHDQKLIHRDVKPENLLLGRRQEVLLSDFGIALVAQTSRDQLTQPATGTVAYMAPEQIQGKPRTASDQYALGVVVYEWLSGALPFTGSALELFGQHLHVPPIPLREKVPGLSSAVEQVVLLALAKDPRQRFASVQAFATALEQASRERESSILVPEIASLPTIGLSKEVTPLPLPIKEQAEPASPFSPTLAASSSFSEVPAVTQEGPDPSRHSEGAPVSSPPGLAETETGAKEALLQNRLPPVLQERGRAGLAGRLGRGQFVAMALGIVLYGGVSFTIDSWYKASSPLATTSLSLFGQSIDSGLALAGIILFIPLVVATTSGPLAGFVTILAGQYLGDIIAGYSANGDYYGGSWSWPVGRILIGLIAGLAVVLTGGQYTTARALGIAFVLSAGAIVLGTAFTTFADIWVQSHTIADAWANFTTLVLPPLPLPFLLVLVLFASTRLRQSRFMQGKRG